MCYHVLYRQAAVLISAKRSVDDIDLDQSSPPSKRIVGGEVVQFRVDTLEQSIEDMVSRHSLLLLVSSLTYYLMSNISSSGTCLCAALGKYFACWRGSGG